MAASCRRKSSTETIAANAHQGPPPWRAFFVPTIDERRTRRIPVNNVDRRTILASGALALAGATTQAAPARAQAGPKAMFPVPATTIWFYDQRYSRVFSLFFVR